MLFALVYATDKTCNKDLSSLTNHDGLIINNQKLPYNNQSHASKFLFLGCCVILDLSINRTPHNTRIAIHRKPTFTDTIIPYSSNHPSQHKFATVRYLYKRLHTYQLQQEDYDQEENTIHNILHNNSFPIKPHSHPKKEHSPKHRITQHPRNKNGLLSHTLEKKPHASRIYLNIPTSK